MKTPTSLAVGLLTLVLAVVPQTAKGPPPPVIDPAKIPGGNERSSNSYWIAPFVKVTEEKMSRWFATTITWYSDDGPIATQPIRHPGLGYAWAREDGRNILLGINESWRLTFPEKPEAIGPIQCTRDSRLFVREVQPAPGQIAVEVYLQGKLSGTLGPFVRHRADGVQLSDDGSLALLVWKDESKSATQVIVADSAGKLRARIDCEDTDRAPIAAPNGAGVILPLAPPRHREGDFTWHTPEGKKDTFEIGPNPNHVGWVPDSTTSLFSVGPGYVHRYQMIDWAAGKVLWNIPCPGENGYPLAIAITPKLVIFSVAVLYKAGPWSGDGWTIEDGRREWIQSFHAVRTEDGALVAKWRPQYPSRFTRDGREHFCKIGGKLYYVTSKEFAEISEEDIFAGRKRWER